jgi:HD-like signal output (HDOD) protein
MTPQYIIKRMSEQNSKPKVMKSWRLPAEIVEAIRRGAEAHNYPDETAYVEAIFRRVLGLPEPPEPKPVRIKKEALALRA